MDSVLSPTVRAWLYRIALPVIALAGIYGLIDGQQAAGWVALAAAILSSGVAVAHTPTKDAQ